ncbi:MAG TPA: DUF484 family protein [Sphingomonas sp.]|uniref:DUF484 family protein n=1 Tax=Sphingomonas sp. TaxID=28214 RepID=UPI002C29278D|nr:DUF484 family protein [Sphingomonas sp.]HMI18787.1 DUF484 family protein [Sphingomonas sp.]
MQRIDFEVSAVATLRKRVSEVEEINEDLIAFARGHAGAVSSIHEAVLAAIACDNSTELATVITCRWPMLLRVDEVAFAWEAGGEAFRANRDGVREVEPRLVERMADIMRPVEMRGVERGHPLFGAACESIRSEALIRLDSFAGSGLIALGQAESATIEGRHGTRLLRFLGQAVSHMLERWPAP